MKKLIVLAIACTAFTSCSKETPQVDTQKNSHIFFRVESVSTQGVSTYSKTVSIIK
jgi:hypothetical protein